MTNYKSGVKAGICTGAIYGIYDWILTTLLLYNSILFAGFSASHKTAIFLSLLPLDVIKYAIGGIFLGLIYAHFYKRLPGKTCFKKALSLEIIGWLILLPFALIAYGFMDIVADVPFIAISVGVSSFLLSLFWKKFSKKRRSK